MKILNKFSNDNYKKKHIPLIINIFKSISKKDNKIIIKSFCLTKFINIDDANLSKISVKINDKKYSIKFKLRRGMLFIKNYRINMYKLILDVNELLKSDIQNKLIVDYDEKYNGRIIYNIFDLFKGKNKNSKIIKINNKAIYFRQTVKNTMYITIRDINYYDYFLGRLKIEIGYILSKFFFKKDYILFYEKESSRYEESASVTYERLIDKGYKNIYYIINKNNIKLKNIDCKYKKNIIYKNSLKHIIYFFKCEKFVGTESIPHSMQLRIANRKILNKYEDKKIKYVFLQHGVMYMISLNSDLRTGFRKSKYRLHKIVVSSKLEANHFIKLGGFNKSDLYICGLPKFDKSERYETADKIVIMLTWRRWEVNEATIDYTKTKYFKMIERIVDGIPKKYHDKIIILPHPLMISAIKNNKDYSKFLPKVEFVYDDILKECALLITDYSSISYDSFYRGSNIIFYWEEKEECLKKYGEHAKLMLNEDNAFGDIAYNNKDLSKLIESNYLKPQKSIFIEKFRKIVTFYDNKNTDRLINMLKEDNLIK